MPDHPHSPDPDKLRALAEAATHAEGREDMIVCGPVSAYYAAANPTAILALLARLESAEGALKGLVADTKDYVRINNLFDADGRPAIHNHWMNAASAHFLKHEGGE